MIILFFKNEGESWVQLLVSVVPTVWESEAESSLEPSILRPVWTIVSNKEINKYVNIYILKIAKWEIKIFPDK
jgi:hypothetical protein